MAFKVGQKVVCVNDAHDKKEIYQSKGLVYPKNGCVYKIRGFHPLASGLYLEELDNSHLSHRTQSGHEPGFLGFRFRPLDYDFVEEVIKQITPKEVEV